jgi:adenine deaminase
MLCTDDTHPDDLVHGHLDLIIKKGLKNGIPFFKLIRAATLNPVLHYSLNVGFLRIGDPADFIIIDNPDNFNVLSTYINGINVASNGISLFETQTSPVVNNFNCSFISSDSLQIIPNGNNIKVINAVDGELLTYCTISPPLIKNNNIISDIENDILKIVIINRYKKSSPSIGFVKNFGLKKGAIASSISHDSHNIIAVGTSDDDIIRIVNKVIENKGGIAAGDENELKFLVLEIAGLMTRSNAETVAKKYSEVNKKAKELGSKLTAPFMTLSFMTLLVIPEIKIYDKGLFDVRSFKPTSLFA